jgi:REP element-mobilizing transposase RayT
MEPREEYFRIYRRHLPHFRARGRLYFVTWRLNSSQRELRPDERSEIVSALEHFDLQRYELTGYVVMNDHVHVLLWPEDEYRLEDILHTWKSFTAHALQQKHGRHESIWQEESFDRIVRNEHELYEKMVYILNNPRKRWSDSEEYPWVWLKGMQ